MRLEQHHIDFLENFCLFGMQSGLSKSTARVLGFLLICQPAAQNAAMIRESLQLSLGSVSNALQTLTAMKVVHQSTPLGERSLYYEVKTAGLVQAVSHKVQLFQHAKEIAKLGLQADQKNDRLATFYTIYDVIETDLAASIAKLKEIDTP